MGTACVLIAAEGRRTALLWGDSTAGACGRSAELVESLACVQTAAGGNRTALLVSDGAAVTLGRTAGTGAAALP